jgi:probable blue pigment (indigoidine) exporter
MRHPWTWLAVTAVAPLAWATNYYVTREFLPPDRPLYGAVVRALPAGLLLLAVCRQVPRGSWWWKAVVLGTLNMSAFFALIYVSAQLLPTSIAATIMAASPLVLMVVAWPLVSERPTAPRLVGATTAVLGVGLMVFSGTTSADPWGVLASGAAMLLSSLGYVLAKRWASDVDLLASTSWQLIAGGITLAVAALIWEGAPPAIDLTAALAFGYVSVVATALAFVCWFAGLRHLPAGAVGVVGLLNPIAGVLLGTALAGESLTTRQVLGLAVACLGLVIAQVVRGKAGSPRRQPPTSPASPADRAWLREGRTC